MVKISRNNSLVEEQLTEPAYYILLSLLTPLHGYGIMQYVEELTEGDFVIGPATLYTILKKFQKQEYIIQDNDDGRKKVYSLTEKGKSIILKEIKRRQKMAEHGVISLKRIGGVIDNE